MQWNAFSADIRMKVTGCNWVRRQLRITTESQSSRWICHFLLQRIFPTQGSSPCLLRGRQIYHWVTWESHSSQPSTQKRNPLIPVSSVKPLWHTKHTRVSAAPRPQLAPTTILRFSSLARMDTAQPQPCWHGTCRLMEETDCTQANTREGKRRR